MNSFSYSYSIDEMLQKKNWSLTESFRYCERLARSHYENFPVGSLLLPKKLRPYVWVLYAFARRADDIADEDFPETERLPALEAWEGLLNRSLHSSINHPVFLALKETLLRFQIPSSWLSDLLTAFKMDVRVKRYADFTALREYCRYSANPVGRLVLWLFGYRQEKLMELSDSVCTALQLANFWQDISVDLKKNRIYLPLDELHRAGYSEEKLFAHLCDASFKSLLRFQVERTEALFRLGAPLAELTGGRLGLELRCVILGGMGILKKIRRLDFDTLTQRPHFKTRDKLFLLLRALCGFRRSLGLTRHSRNTQTPRPEDDPIHGSKP